MIWSVGKSYALLLAGWCMGLFSYADGETAGTDLLGVGLVDIGHNLLKRGRVKPLGENGSPADDVLTCGELFGVPVQHLLLDDIPEGFCFSLGLFDEFFKAAESLDLCGEFIVDILGCSFFIVFRRLSGCHSAFVFYPGLTTGCVEIGLSLITP